MHYLRSFEYIVSVCEEGTFSAAAKRLGIAQSSLSVAVQKIEEELGYPIFDRSTNPLSVTKAGAIYIRGIRELLLNHNQLLEQINDAYDSVNGSIVIGMAPTKAYFLTPYLYAQLRAAYPRISLTIIERQSSQLLPLLVEGQIDLVYTTVDETGDLGAYDVEVVCEERMALAARKNGRLTQKCRAMFASGTSDLSELRDVGFISFEKEQLLTTEMTAIFSALHVTPDIHIRVSSILSALPLVKADLGIMFIPSSYTQYPELAADFDFYFFDAAIYQKHLAIITRKKQYKSKPVLDAIALIKTIK